MPMSKKNTEPIKASPELSWRSEGFNKNLNEFLFKPSETFRTNLFKRNEAVEQEANFED